MPKNSGRTLKTGRRAFRNWKQRLGQCWSPARLATAGAAAIFTVLLFVVVPALNAKGEDDYKDGIQAETARSYDEAFRYFQAAAASDPNNPQFLMAVERTRLQAASEHIKHGNDLQTQGDLEAAAQEYEAASIIDPSSPIARQSLAMVRAKMEDIKNGVAADQEESALKDALGPPALKPLSRAPIDLKVTNDSKVVLETIAKLAGVNVLFHTDYTSKRISVDLSNVSLEEALDQVALVTKSFWKPISRNAILMIPDDAVHRRDQEQQIIKTFYLSNTITPQDLTEVVTAIRTLLETRRIQQVNSMNAIILRDTPDKVALAEKIIRDVDKAKPEVVVDVAVLEVRRDKARQLGLAPGSPGLSIPLTFTPGGTAPASGTGGTTTSPTMTLKQLGHIGSGDFSITLPGATLNALLTDTRTKILQRPEVRASDGMKATLRIGDKVPIATGAYQPGVAGATVSALVNTQFQYLDVGVNLDITPKVHQNEEITLKLRIEVSAVTSTAEPVPGVKQPVIGQRVIEHDIRLKEGEINVLGGILQTGTTHGVSGIPGISQIPLLKYLFSNVSDSVAEDEILIVLRPHTVRLPDITLQNTRSIDIGTEGDVHLREGAVTTAGAQPVDVLPAPSASLGAPPQNNVQSNPPNAPAVAPQQVPGPGVPAQAVPNTGAAVPQAAPVLVPTPVQPAPSSGPTTETQPAGTEEPATLPSAPRRPVPMIQAPAPASGKTQ